MSELNFLKVLKLQIESPTHGYLCRVLQQHQRIVPYENLSKLISSASGDCTIPNLANYVHDIETFGYGGTCFAQNIYLQQLLNYLGFSTTMHGNWVDGRISHPSLAIRMDDKNYYVDLGIMSTFVGPFELDPKHNFTRQIGNQTFQFATADDYKSSHLKIFRAEKLIRELQNTGPVPEAKQIEAGILKTFEKTEMFMTNLVVHKVFEDYGQGIWNKNFYRYSGVSHEVTDLQTVDDLRIALLRLEISNIHLSDVLKTLHIHGVDLF